MRQRRSSLLNSTQFGERTFQTFYLPCSHSLSLLLLLRFVIQHPTNGTRPRSHGQTPVFWDSISRKSRVHFQWITCKCTSTGWVTREGCMAAIEWMTLRPAIANDSRDWEFNCVSVHQWPNSILFLFPPVLLPPSPTFRRKGFLSTSLEFSGMEPEYGPPHFHDVVTVRRFLPFCPSIFSTTRPLDIKLGSWCYSGLSQASFYSENLLSRTKHLNLSFWVHSR